MPWEAFPSGPVTHADKRKILLDEVEELINVWLVNTSVDGMYKILIDVADEVQSSPQKIMEISQKVKEVFCSNRCLSEDIDEVVVLTHIA